MYAHVCACACVGVYVCTFVCLWVCVCLCVFLVSARYCLSEVEMLQMLMGDEEVCLCV